MIDGSFVQLLFFVLLLVISPSKGSYKQRFEKQFNDTCRRYPFVEKYWSNIHEPKNKTVVFVFHEAGLNNCGLGDRMSGVLTAILLALRFNRTLLIKVSLYV